MFIVRRQYAPRIKAIMKIKTLFKQMDAMEIILKQIKSDKEQAAEKKSVMALKQSMDGAIVKIRVCLFWAEILTFFCDYFSVFLLMCFIECK